MEKTVRSWSAAPAGFPKLSLRKAWRRLGRASNRLWLRIAFIPKTTAALADNPVELTPSRGRHESEMPITPPIETSYNRTPRSLAHFCGSIEIP